MHSRVCIYLCPDEGLLAPLRLRVRHGDPDSKADQRVRLHSAQQAVVLLLDVAPELSSANGQRLEHVQDAHRRPHLTRRCFLKAQQPNERQQAGNARHVSVECSVPTAIYEYL